MKMVIGLVGVKTSGKSTVATIIKNILKHEQVTEAALADKLKNVCSIVFNIPRNYFDDQKLKEVSLGKPILLTISDINKVMELYNIFDNTTPANIKKIQGSAGFLLETPRQIAQIIGTEILRGVGDEDIHCKNVKLSEKITIISDIRFPNEFDYFNKLDNTSFLPLYIQRDEAEKHVTEKSHSSETSVFKFSHKCVKINNNKDLQNLESEIRTNLLIRGFTLKEYNL
jgi:energy-coupling factor transporter ATP-binding protein EcfA2